MIDINCDMGEGIGNEALLMPYITSANIACGGHAGDEGTMNEVVSLCIKHGVHIGAHPSFVDRENFGRTEMQLPVTVIYSLITEQLQLLSKIVNKQGAILHHIKPHGALYNMAAKDAVLAKAIAQAVKDFDASLIFFGLSGSVMIDEAVQLGLPVAHEVFADRTYQADGSLTPRTMPGALLHNGNDVIQQVKNFTNLGKVTAITGDEIFIKADTICIHGDGEHAVEFAKIIYQNINEK